VSSAEADGFTSAIPASNDITANDILSRDPASPNGARQGHRRLRPVRPGDRDGLDPAKLVCAPSQRRRAAELSDLRHVFSAQELVSKISHDMTLLPGDSHRRGTRRRRRDEGAGPPVTVAIDGIGELTNEFRL